MTQKILTRQLLIAVAAACILGFLNGINQPAHAEAQGVVIDIPVYGQTLYSDLTTRAESLVSNAINDQFGQNPGLSTIQVVVTGDRHGEIIPILTTTVSRTQWQENPQVNAWTKYYSASQALLQRHEQTEIVAMAPSRSTTVSGLERAFQIDEAFDSGRLTGQPAQEYLSDLD
ncbi:MAG: hypothetical protein KME12_16455 [Trichocoleus desertorum ATA4-8-CV12]|nr:hypothetical protein [Trichocoleus desertorum ATA4-8-CV12]